MVPYADGRDAPMRIRTVDFPSWNLCETGLVIPGRISAEASTSVVGLMRILLSCAFVQNACEYWNYGDLLREEGLRSLKTPEDKGTLQSRPLPLPAFAEPFVGDGTDRTSKGAEHYPEIFL